ncbi:MAG: glycosyltransferase, partial [Edaphobacter sp.]
MSHFGVLAYGGTGHLNPLIALSRQLISRGHRVTLFQHSELEQRVRQHGLDFFPVEISRVSLSKQQHGTAPLEKAAWIGEIRYKLNRTTAEMEAYLQQYPAAVRAAGVDTLILGEISLAGPTVAEMLRLPYFIVSTSIPHNFGWDAPRTITTSRSRLERMQKELLEVSVLRMKGPILRSLDRFRKRVGLGSISEIRKTFPELAHITQWPQCLE